MFVAIVVTFAIGYAKIYSERESRLNFALSWTPETSESPFVENKIFDDVALIYYNTDKERVEKVFVGKSFDQDIMYDDVETIINAKKNQGIVGGFMYEKTTQDNIIKIALNSFSSSYNNLETYFLSTILALIIGIFAYLLVSVLLAKIAVKPVEESWKKQRQFVADASHELKTPLSVIMANVDMLAEHKEESIGSQMKWIENTQSEAKRMADLVADLLFLAKNDDGVQVALEDINLSEVVATIVLGYDAIFYENKKDFNYDIQQNLHVEGNERQLQQLVTILLDNANKYSVGNGDIQLHLTSNGRHIEMEVSNISAQLTDEQLSHLFDRFYTVDPSRNRDSGGNGLGLSIAKTICETHSGSIRVDCENEKTTFKVTLPLSRKK